MAAKLGLVLAIVCTLYVHTYGQPSCTPALTGLVPCLGYITGNATTPAPTCCTQLDAVVKSLPQCLCLVIGSNAAATLGIPINQTQALALPGACNVKTPSPALCNTLAGTPAASPAPAGAPQSSASASTPSPTRTPTPAASPASTSGTTTKPAAASPAPSTSGSSTNSLPSLMAVAAIFLVSCASAIGAF